MTRAASALRPSRRPRDYHRGFTTLSGGLQVIRSNDRARFARRRTRAAITTAAALCATAAFTSGPAYSAVHPDATEPLSGFPLSYTDDRGTAATTDDLA